MLFNRKLQDDASPELPGNHPLPANFSPPDQLLAASRRPGGAATRSVIDAWLTITGNLQSEGEVQVDGQINGNINCAHLIVGNDATIVGDIAAEDVVVRGKLQGMVRANRVVLQDTARVESEIIHKLLSIEEGAIFEGMARRRQNPLQDENAASPMAGPQPMSAEAEAERANGAVEGNEHQARQRRERSRLRALNEAQSTERGPGQ